VKYELYLSYFYQISHLPVKEKNILLKDFHTVCSIPENQCLIFLCAFAFFVVKYEVVRFVSVQVCICGFMISVSREAK